MSHTTQDAGFLREVVLYGATGIVTVDDGDEVVLANERACALAGRTRRSLVGTSVTELFEDGAGTIERARTRAGDSDGQAALPATIRREGGEEVPVSLVADDTEYDGRGYVTLTVTDEDGHPQSVSTDHRAVDRSDRTTRETHRLAALTETRRRLAGLDDAESVADACIGALAEVLGHRLGCVRFTTEGDTLETVAMTTAARKLVDANPGFEFALSAAGRAFRTGDPVVRRDPADTAVSDILTAGVHFPLGEHGVLSVATTSGETITHAQLDTLEFLAGGVKATLDRIERERRCQEQRAAMRARQERLEAATDVAGDTYDLLSELPSADSSDELERMTCRQLAGSETYAGAWVAELDATGERLHVTHSEGIDSGVIDGRSVSEVFGTDLAAMSGPERFDVETVFDTIEDVESGESVDSVGVVPLMTGDRAFGLLGVLVSEPDVFEAIGERSLRVLGETIGFGLSSLKNERLLLSDESLQLEFQVTDPNCLAVALSAELDTFVSMQRTVQNTHDEHLSYVRIEEADPDTALDAASSVETVQSCRLIDDYEDGCLIEVTRSSSGAEVMMEFGATTRRAEADAGQGTLVLEAPHTVDVRRVVQAYQTYNPQSELLSKRKVDRPVQTAEQLRADIESKLTQKQRSAVTSAFFSGYYDWPRASTAEEIADSMGITAATLHQHLRRAHQKILGSLLEASSSHHL